MIDETAILILFSGLVLAAGLMLSGIALSAIPDRAQQLMRAGARIAYGTMLSALVLNTFKFGVRFPRWENAVILLATLLIASYVPRLVKRYRGRQNS